jgi:hypothetical protein
VAKPNPSASNPQHHLQIRIVVPSWDEQLDDPEPLFVYGYIVPAGVSNLRAWIESDLGAQGSWPGTPIHPPAPFDWGFFFDRVPFNAKFRQVLRLIVEAADSDGRCARDLRVVGYAPALPQGRPPEIQIGSPGDGDTVSRQFSSMGWVTGTTVNSVTVQSAAGGGAVAGTPSTAVPEVYDWQYDFNLAPNFPSGRATLTATPAAGTPDSKTIYISDTFRSAG